MRVGERDAVATLADPPRASGSVALIEELRRLGAGDLGHRLARGGEDDAVAAAFNEAAESIEQLVLGSRDQERRLAATIDRLSSALSRFASGELDGVLVERDYRGDAVDVLVFLVNNAIAEYGALVAAREQRADAERKDLEGLVAEGQRILESSQESFRALFEVAPQPLVLFDLERFAVIEVNDRAAALFERSPLVLCQSTAVDLFDDLESFHALRDPLLRGESIAGCEFRLRTGSGHVRHALVGASLVSTVEGERCVAGFTDLTVQKKIEDELREAAATDALTGTLRRGRFFEASHHEWNRAKRYARPVCVALVDLDHFKTINDRFGHLVGDECLRRVGTCLLATVRGEDWVGRYGGEEFAIVFTETRLEAGAEAIERIRVAISNLVVEVEGQRVPLAMSGGVAERRIDEDFETTLGRADTALYEAKSLGRDRTIASRA